MRESKFDIAYATRELKGVGLDPEEVIPLWTGNSASPKAVDANLAVLRTLQATEKGSPKLLTEIYGIQNFGRYPADVLLKQLGQRDNRDDPYVLWSSPLVDTNGEFYKFAGQIGRFSESLGSVSLRIVESDAKSFPQRLRDLRQRYSPITTAVWGGHGHPNGIVMGGDEDVTIDTLKGKEGEQIKSCFAPNPSIALVSCSTGAEGGFAQELSALVGGKVQAPKYRTSLELVKAIYHPRGVDLKISYVNELAHPSRDYLLKGDKAVYERGRLVA